MKTRDPKRAAAPIALGLILAVAGPFGTAGATTTDIEIEHTTKLTKKHVEVITKTGTLIVAKVRDARKAIAKRDRAVAKRRTGEAAALLLRARAASPTLRLRDSIQAAHGKLVRAGKLDQQDLLPIFAELDSVSREDAKVVREHLDAANAAHAKGHEENLEASLVAASTSVRLMEIDLPIEATHHDLARALHQIDRRELTRADRYLRAAQDKVHTFVGMAVASGVAAEDEED